MKIGDMVAQWLLHLHICTTLEWESFGFCPKTCRLFQLETLLSMNETVSDCQSVSSL